MTPESHDVDLESLRETPPWAWPEGAASRLLATLRNVDAPETERLLAAELGGESVVANDELALALLAIVGSAHASEKLRGQAAISLGPALELADTMGSGEGEEDPTISEEVFRRVQRSLRELHSDGSVPRGVRRRILEASVRAQEEWHGDAVRAAYRSGDESWRLTAVFCMRYVGGFDDEILESLRSPDPDVRYEAVCAAGSWGVGEAWAPVASLATDEDTEKELRLAAIEALGTIRPRRSQGILLELTDSEDDDVADAAYEALAVANELAEEEGDGNGDDS
jgi:HEAT repeat protein